MLRFVFTVVVIDFAVFGGTTVTDFDTMLNNYTLSVHAITNVNGDGVLLRNDGKLFNAGKDSFANYVPNIAFSSLNLLTDISTLCSNTKYKKEYELVSEKVTQIEISTSLNDVAVNQVW